jgi:hypothetical protein
MNDEEKMIIKSLNKIGVDTRFISLYDNKIFINNLKFSKFSRKKEEKFIKEYPSIEIIRSKLFQKICIKVSRTVKHNIKPKDTLYIKNDESIENILLYMVLEPYKRKYGITIIETNEDELVNVSPKCLDDFTNNYLQMMTNGDKIRELKDNNMIYPLEHVPYAWMKDWINSNDILFKNGRIESQTIEHDILTFLEQHIPNVQESIKQSVNFFEDKKGR